MTEQQERHEVIQNIINYADEDLAKTAEGMPAAIEERYYLDDDNLNALATLHVEGMFFQMDNWLKGLTLANQLAGIEVVTDSEGHQAFDVTGDTFRNILSLCAYSMFRRMFVIASEYQMRWTFPKMMGDFNASVDELLHNSVPQEEKPNDRPDQD